VAVRGYINLVQLPTDTNVAWRNYEEGAEYARRHRVEEPLLAAVGAEVAFNRGEWDRAEELIAQLPEGSFGRTYATWVRGVIRLARSGQELALPILLEIPTRNAGSPEPGVRRFGLAMLAFWHAAAGDRDMAKRCLAECRASLREAAGVRIPVWPLAFAALFCDEADWLKIFESELRERPRQRPGTWDNLATVAALFDGDAEACAKALAKIAELDRTQGRAQDVFLILARAKEARRRGLALGNEWRELLDAAREEAARIRAAYWLAELDALARETIA
jgi:hypothetical protein